MKTGTKLTFHNNDFGYITDYFLGGSYIDNEFDTDLWHTNQNMTITRDNIVYELVESDYEFISSKILEEKIVDGITRYRMKFTILPKYDLEALKQNLEARCSIIRGDVLYNTRLGIPLGLPVSETKLSVLNTINSTYGVRTCQVLNNYISNKKYVMDVKINSNLGETIITVG